MNPVHRIRRPSGLQAVLAALALLAAALLPATTARAQAVLPPGLAFELISPAEAAREAAAAAHRSQPPRMRALPQRAAPAIRVLAPNPGGTAHSPLRIELAFEPAPGARIVPESFRVLYGVLKIDLTERLKRFASVSERGVVVEQAQVPEGLHRLFLQVADDQGHQGEQELRVRVAAGS